MERIYTTQIGEHVGERVRLAGWLHALRRMGGINFLVLRDVRGTAQIVVDTPEALAALEGLLPETVLAVEGIVSAEPQAPGGFELHGPVFEILSPVRDALPFPLNKPEVKAGLPVFLDHAVIGLRHPTRRALFRLSAGTRPSLRQTLSSLGFTEIQTPKLVASATESGANVFAVDYLGQRAFLAQSPQFTNRSWSACSSACLKSPRFSAPSRMTPSATSTNTSAWTSKWGSSGTTLM